MSGGKQDIEGKPRILLAAKQRIRGGGQEKNYIEIARHFRDKYQFSFLFAGGYTETDLRDIGRVYTFPGRALKVLFPLDFLFLAHVIRKERIDIVHAHHRYPAFIASLLRKLTGTRQLSTAHNVFPDKGRFSRWGDHVVAVSHGVEHWLKETCGVADDMITVIHNGISPPRRWNEDKLAKLRQETGVGSGTPLLCSVGRLLPQKNYNCLFQALSVIRDIDWHLLLIGEGDEEKTLVDLALQLGLADRISFLGFRDDVVGLMQLSDLYVMSSAWEGLPYVLVEALANSLPVIATDVGGVSEVVLDGKTGLLVKPGTPDMLAEKIRTLLCDAETRNEMARHSRQHFEDHFLDTTMFESLDNVYQTLLRHR